MPKNQPLKVFISYSHKDKNLKEKLERHLAALKSLGEVALWHDQEVEAGTEWEPQIKAALEEADILLLLVSSDFISSEYINNIELKAALKRHYAGTARVIPILLRPVHWEGTDISRLERLPKNKKAITDWGKEDEDNAFVDVAQGLSKVVASLRAEKYKLNTNVPPQPAILISNQAPRQKPSYSYPPPDKGERFSGYSDSSSKALKGRRLATQPNTCEQTTRPQKSRSLTPKIIKVAEKTWYYLFPIFMLWILIGTRQQSIDDIAGQGEMLGFLSWGSLGGFLTGILASLAWQHLSPSRFQVDALLLWSLVGLVAGGLSWTLVYFVFGPSVIQAQGTLIGLGIGFVLTLVLTWRMGILISSNSHR